MPRPYAAAIPLEVVLVMYGPWFVDAVKKAALSHLPTVDPTRQLRADLHRALTPHIKTLDGIAAQLLPPNLREISGDITCAQVYEFLETEGIPLYLVPRATIGKQLLLAEDRDHRLQILHDKLPHIAEDCTLLMDACLTPQVRDGVSAVRDGIGALQAGYHVSAQAGFTVTLDSLISRFSSVREKKSQITKKTSDQLPDLITDMGLRESYVWLPVWNAHDEYYVNRGDRVPYIYNRHATVHSGTKGQFSKRNCVQALMLVSSLIGYGDQLARAADT